MSNVAVVGMGYVGIPIAALLANAGHIVVGIQRRSERSGWKIDALNRGECPIANEPELPDMLRCVVSAGQFHATDDFDYVTDSDFVLIDVQTPVGDDHLPLYDSFKAACCAAGRHLHPGTTVIVESTVAPGTTLNIARPILEQESGLKAGLPDGFGLAFSCERVMVGKLVHNIQQLTKIVGGIDQASTDTARTLYGSVVFAGILTTDILTAEVAKTAENAYRDVQIAFANEIALICDSLGVDVYDVRALVNSLSDRHMLLPGAGVGGHCLPKDSWLLLHALQQTDVSATLLANARRINDFMPLHVADLLGDALEAAGRVPTSSTVCILGYAYLENSDDDRNSPSARLLDVLEGRGIRYVVHDPFVRNDWIETDMDAAIKGCDAAVLMTKHECYRALTPATLKALLRTPILVDGRNVFAAEEFIKAGFIFRAVGKGKTNR